MHEIHRHFRNFINITITLSDVERITCTKFVQKISITIAKNLSIETKMTLTVAIDLVSNNHHLVGLYRCRK